MRRRAAAAGFTGVAGVLALASAALACTMIMGITKISNATNGSYVVINKEGTTTGQSPGGLSGSKGNTLAVKAWELPPGGKYKLWFIWPASVATGIGCHEVDATTGTIMKNPAGVLVKMKADGAGMLDSNPNLAGAQPYKALIPTDPKAVSGGTAEICGREIPTASGGWASGVYESATQHVKLTIL